MSPVFLWLNKTDADICTGRLQYADSVCYTINVILRKAITLVYMHHPTHTHTPLAFRFIDSDDARVFCIPCFPTCVDTRWLLVCVLRWYAE